MPTRIHRRGFLQTSTALGIAASSGALLKPSRVLGANERLNIGVIGVGGRGAGDLAAVAGENIVALCDVDEGRLNAAAARHSRGQEVLRLSQAARTDGPRRRRGRHARPSSRAGRRSGRLRRGLHVYCEKPLTHTVAEARLIAQTAAKKKVATQMGTQNHEHPGYLRLVELIQSGAIGKVQRGARHHRPAGPLVAAGNRAARRASRRFPRISSGICGSARRPSATITRPTCRSSGAAGGTLAAARSATWRST